MRRDAFAWCMAFGIWASAFAMLWCTPSQKAALGQADAVAISLTNAVCTPLENLTALSPNALTVDFACSVASAGEQALDQVLVSSCHVVVPVARAQAFAAAHAVAGDAGGP